MNSETTGPLVAAFAKIERTKTQIDDICARVHAFAGSNPYEVVSEMDPTGQEKVWFFRLTKRIDNHLPVVVGEAIHNLRTPLDQMISAVSVKCCGGTGAFVSFSFGHDEKAFKSALTKQKELLPADALALMAACKPYRGGNDLLWALHELSICDKHRQDLIPVNLNHSWRCGFFAVEKGGKPLVLGDRNFGGHLVFDNYVALSRPPCSEDRFEFLTTSPGTVFHTDMCPTISIAFGKIEPLKREPIVGVLNQMRDIVEGILLTFEKRFF